MGFGDLGAIMKKDVNLEVEKLKKELDELKQSLGEKSSRGPLKKLSFLQGMIFMTAISSVIAFAATLTKPHTFTSGNVIKASEVNANFDTLYTRVNDLDLGYIATASSDFMMTCTSGGTSYSSFALNQGEKNDGGYDTTSYVYTVQKSGYYIYYYSIARNAGSYSVYNKPYINNVYTSMSNATVKKYNAGDTFKVEVSCDNKGGSTTTIDSAKTYIALVPL